MRGTRARSILGLAAARLTRDRTRTVLAILGVTLAVLSTTLLGSLGVGVIDTGQAKFDAADRDLWVSGGPTRIAPGTAGGFEAGIVNAHQFERTVSAWDSVNTASPLLFQTVYIGATPNSLQTVVAVGTIGSGGLTITNGSGFPTDTQYYNNGSYNGTRSNKLVLSPSLRTKLNVQLGDQIYIGGTIADAKQTTYTVTGTSSTFATFLGSSTVAIPLAELQTMTGAAYTDSASLITIDVKASADVTNVSTRLETTYPQYTVRSNREQLQAVLANRILILAAGLVLTVLAIISGIALTINLLALLVAQEQATFGALRAIGLSRTTIAGLIAAQGLCYGALGALIGISLTYPAAAALNAVTVRLVGFQGLVQVTPRVLAAGAVIALVAGLSTALVAGYRATGVNPLEALRA